MGSFSGRRSGEGVGGGAVEHQVIQCAGCFGGWRFGGDVESTRILTRIHGLLGVLVVGDPVRMLRVNSTPPRRGLGALLPRDGGWGLCYRG